MVRLLVGAGYTVVRIPQLTAFVPHPAVTFICPLLVTLPIRLHTFDSVDHSAGLADAFMDYGCCWTR